MHAGQRARRDAVTVHVQIAGKLLHLFQLFGVEHLAAVRAIGVVPRQTPAHPVIHADVQITGHEHRCLKALGKIERAHAEPETLFGISRKEHDVLGIAMRGVRERHEVALLRARRHAGGRAGALHIVEDGGNLRVVRETDEFLHQRNAGP